MRRFKKPRTCRLASSYESIRPISIQRFPKILFVTYTIHMNVNNTSTSRTAGASQTTYAQQYNSGGPPLSEVKDRVKCIKRDSVSNSLRTRQNAYGDTESLLSKFPDQSLTTDDQRYKEIHSAISTLEAHISPNDQVSLSPLIGGLQAKLQASIGPVPGHSWPSRGTDLS